MITFEGLGSYSDSPMCGGVATSSCAGSACKVDNDADQEKVLALGYPVERTNYTLSPTEVTLYNTVIEKLQTRVDFCRAHYSMTGCDFDASSHQIWEIHHGQRAFINFTHQLYGARWGVFYVSLPGDPTNHRLQIKPDPPPSDWLSDAIDWIADKFCELSKGVVGDIIYGGIGAISAAVTTGGMGAVAGAKAGLSAQTKVANACGLITGDAPPLDTTGTSTVTTLIHPIGLLLPHPQITVPSGQTSVASTPKYAGATARWHVGEQCWWMYFPKGLGGDEAPTPDAKEPGTSTTPPAGSIIGPTIEPTPFYKQSWFWPVVGGGVVVLGTGGYLLLRKRRPR